MTELKSYPVWDAGTRWFHWITVACVLGLVAVGLVIMNAGSLGITNDGKILLKTVHVWIGYVFAINLLWRFVWAFLGNRHARFSALLPGGTGYMARLRSYVAAFFSPTPQTYLGHNPAARLAIAALLLLLTLQAVTGLVLAGTDVFMPPFGHWIAQWIAAPGVAPETLVAYTPEMYDQTAYEAMRSFRKPFITVHEYSFYALMIMVVVHIAAVIITDIREGGSIISAMFTGKKILEGKPEDDEPGL
ncbi:MAG: cytochrome b/b6 domain-containing protein [Porticoccaceae bacterium]|nr:cytochrome b/b6 domain-containing protein [Porticoccaceae bacterium]